MTIWTAITSIPNGTRIYNYGWDQCVAFANHYHAALGGAFVPVQSAYQWWTGDWAEVRRLYTRSSTPVAGALFVSRGGGYNTVDGHIGLVTKVHADGSFDTMEQNAGPWRYVGRYTRGMSGILGFLIPRNNPASQPLTPQQRMTGDSPARRRTAPTTQSAEKQPILAANTVGNFVAWKTGEHVNDGKASTSVWFQGESGDWFWAGAFTSQATTGLKDLNPVAPPTPTPTPTESQRQVDPTPVNVRSKPSAEGTLTGSLPANAIVTPQGWVTGQSVQGIAFWYSVQGGYAWAGGFTREDASGLKDLNSTTPPPVDPPLPIDPTAPTEDFGPGLVLGKIGNWSKKAPDFDLVMNRPVPSSVDLKLPGHIIEVFVKPNGGFNVGREGAPVHGVLHHGGQPNLGYSATGHHSGLVQSCMGPDAPTTQYALKDDMIVSMVDESDTAATNNRWMSNTYGINIEVANDKTTTDKPSAKSHESAAWVFARAALRWGWKLPLARLEVTYTHKEVSKTGTSCPGLLDADWITKRANEIVEASRTEQPVPKPDYSDLTAALKENSGLLRTLIDLLKSIFKLG